MNPSLQQDCPPPTLTPLPDIRGLTALQQAEIVFNSLQLCRCCTPCLHCPPTPPLLPFLSPDAQTLLLACLCPTLSPSLSSDLTSSREPSWTKSPCSLLSPLEHPVGTLFQAPAPLDAHCCGNGRFTDLPPHRSATPPGQSPEVAKVVFA